MNSGNESDNTGIIIAIVLVSALVGYLVIAYFMGLPPFSSSGTPPTPPGTPPGTPAPPGAAPVPGTPPEPTPEDEREETTFVHNVGAGGTFGSGPSLGLGGVASAPPPPPPQQIERCAKHFIS